MTVPYPRPSRRVIVLLDVALVGWLLVWFAIAVSVAREVQGLAELSDTAAIAGAAIERTGQAIVGLQEAPFVGERVADVGAAIERAGESTRASARSSRDSIRDLTALLGISIALIPTLPLAALYVPLRIAWLRERGAMRRRLLRCHSDAVFKEFLARRAVQTLSFERLLAVSTDPWRDLEIGRYDDLARASRSWRLSFSSPSSGGSGTRRGHAPCERR